MYKQKIDAYFEKHRDEMVKNICRLINIKSVRGEPQNGMPFGEGPAAALAEALKIASELGFKPKNMENYVGVVDLNQKETELTILSHLDVVPEGKGWTKEPFSAAAQDGKIFGRGASDDKGPSIAALYALAAAREIEPSLGKNARLVLGTAEETGSEDIAYYYGREKASPFTFSPDGDFPIINAEKGRYAPTLEASWAESADLPRIVSIRAGEAANAVPSEAVAVVEGLDFEVYEEYCDMYNEYTGAEFSLSQEGNLITVTAKGRGAHAAELQQGNNALTAMIFLLSHTNFAPSESYNMICQLNTFFSHGDFYGKGLGIEQKDEVSGPLTLSLDVMDYRLTGFLARFDCRFPISGTKEGTADAADAAFRAKGIEIKGQDSFTPPHYVPADSPFVKTLLSAFEEHTDCEGKCLAIGGGTYVHGIEGAVAFGCTMPGRDNHIHGADEYVIIDEIITGAKIFTQAILDICK